MNEIDLVEVKMNEIGTVEVKMSLSECYFKKIKSKK